MSYDPWMDERNQQSNIFDRRAAEQAREAASFAGQEIVSAQIEEARRISDQAAQDVAQRMAGEAAMLREQQARAAQIPLTSQPTGAASTPTGSTSEESSPRTEPNWSADFMTASSVSQPEKVAKSSRLSQIRSLPRRELKTISGQSALASLLLWLGAHMGFLLITGSFFSSWGWLNLIVLVVCLTLPLASWLQADDYALTCGLAAIPPMISCSKFAPLSGWAFTLVSVAFSVFNFFAIEFLTTNNKLIGRQ